MLFGALSTVLNAAEASASRLPRLFASASASSSRQMSTLHLGNLAPAKGSRTDVRSTCWLHPPLCSTNLLSRTLVRVVVRDQVTASSPDAVTRVSSRAAATASPHPGLQAARRRSKSCSPSAVSSTSRASRTLPSRSASCSRGSRSRASTPRCPSRSVPLCARTFCTASAATAASSSSALLTPSSPFPRLSLSSRASPSRRPRRCSPPEERSRPFTTTT